VSVGLNFLLFGGALGDDYLRESIRLIPG
jgi:hypothetical protein